MIAYKLVRKLKDGSLAPLFINKKQRIPIGEWMQAEDHPTEGYTLTPSELDNIDSLADSWFEYFKQANKDLKL